METSRFPPSQVHMYKFIQTLGWSGLVCQRCGNWVGKLVSPGKMIVHHMPTMRCTDPFEKERRLPARVVYQLDNDIASLKKLIAKKQERLKELEAMRAQVEKEQR